MPIRRSGLVLLSVGAILLLSVLFTGCAHTAPTVGLTGRVVPAEGGADGFKVWLQHGGTETAADGNGNFSLGNLPPGFNRLYLSKGRKTISREITLPESGDLDLGEVTFSSSVNGTPALAKSSSPSKESPPVTNLSLQAISAASGVATSKLAKVARSLKLDPAALAEFERTGAFPTGATNTLTRRDVVMMGITLGDQLTKEEAAAILEAITGMSVKELKAWLDAHLRALPLAPDGSLTQDTLASALVLLRRDHFNPGRVGWPSNEVARALSSKAGEYVLYDGSQGTMPDAQHWWLLKDPLKGLVRAQWQDGSTRLDTTQDRKEKAGFFSEDPLCGEIFRHPNMPILDRDAGFTVEFEAAVRGEQHVRDDRAGFNVIVVCDDLKAIELSYWNDRVFAQDDNGKPIFQDSHAETASLPKAGTRTRYELRVMGNGYELAAAGQPVLKGRLRDYTAFGGFPYDTPNFVFLGDDSTSGSAVSEVARVVIRLQSNTVVRYRGGSTDARVAQVVKADKKTLEILSDLAAAGELVSIGAKGGADALLLGFTDDDELKIPRRKPGRGGVDIRDEIVDASRPTPGVGKAATPSRLAATNTAELLRADAEAPIEDIAAGTREFKFGAVLVTTDPPWSDVRIERLAPLMSPALFRSLLPRNYQFVVEEPGFQKLRFSARPTPGTITRTNVVLQPEAAASLQTPPVEVYEGEEKVGDFSTIAAAVAGAPPGGRVVVSRGRYHEHLVIERDVVIEGRGDRRLIMLDVKGEPCLRVTAGRAVVRGLSFRQSGDQVNDTYAVEVTGGELQLENCDIASLALGGMAVRGAGSRATLQRCEIRRCRDVGLLVTQGAGIAMERCVVDGSAGNAVEVRDGAQADFRQTTFRDAGQAGLLVHRGGRCVVEGSRAFVSGRAGIEIRDGGSADLKQTSIYFSRGAGIYVHDGGILQATECDVGFNKLANVEVARCTGAVVSLTGLHHGRENGVLLHEGGALRLDRCSVSGNILAGVECRGRGALQENDSSLSRGFASGLLVHGDGVAHLRKSRIEGNELAGIELRDQGELELVNSVVACGRQTGFLLMGESRVKVQDTEISAHLAHGVEMRSSREAAFLDCRFVRNALSGLQVAKAGRGSASSCLFKFNGDPAILVDPAGQLTQSGNRME